MSVNEAIEGPDYGCRVISSVTEAALFAKKLECAPLKITEAALRSDYIGEKIGGCRFEDKGREPRQDHSQDVEKLRLQGTCNRGDIYRQTQTDRHRPADTDPQTNRHSKLVFYAQSTGTVISALK